MTPAMAWEWNIAIFCMNEAKTIATCIDSVADAIGDRRALITLVVNGSTDRSAEIAWQTAQDRGVPIQIYTIAHADKANAINRFYYELREPADVYFFVDAYVKVGARALDAMARLLSEDPRRRAATGIAVSGRTMPLATEATLQQGGIVHGQLHALPASFIDDIVQRGIRLPIGLYYGDGLLASMANHNLDPIANEWLSRRVAGVREATYEIPVLSMFRLDDWRRQLRRTVRQIRGRMENAAITDIVYQRGYNGLPEYSNDMVKAFLATHPTPRLPLWKRPFQVLALRQIRNSTLPAPTALMPRPWQPPSPNP